MCRRSPEYRGRTAVISKNRQAYTVDNRLNVPHFPVLSKAFKIYINVELCRFVLATIYLLKFINRWCDAGVLRQDYERHLVEVDNFLTGRFINENEAAYRIQCAVKTKS